MPKNASCKRWDTPAFGEDMGDIQEVIRLSPTAQNTPLTISFYAGDFEKGVEIVHLLWGALF